MEQQASHNYTNAIRQIKSAILKSRYRAAAMANRELLSLYYGIGKYISENSRDHFWGTNAIETISRQLQQELPGLREFLISNLKNMRQFYEAWEVVFANRQSTTGEIETTDFSSIRPLTTDEVQTDLLITNRSPMANEIQTDILTVNRQPVTADLQPFDIVHFLSIGFTHHYAIIAKTTDIFRRKPVLYSALRNRILE